MTHGKICHYLGNISERDWQAGSKMKSQKEEISYTTWTISESDQDMKINVAQLTKHFSFIQGRNKINYIII